VLPAQTAADRRRAWYRAETLSAGWKAGRSSQILRLLFLRLRLGLHQPPRGISAARIACSTARRCARTAAASGWPLAGSLRASRVACAASPQSTRRVSARIRSETAMTRTAMAASDELARVTWIVSIASRPLIGRM
jgi:hypothetical protein